MMTHSSHLPLTFLSFRSCLQRNLLEVNHFGTVNTLRAVVPSLLKFDGELFGNPADLFEFSTENVEFTPFFLA